MTTLVEVSAAAFMMHHYLFLIKRLRLGSTTVYPYNDTSLPELELGASIFVQANKNLWRASDEFNLTRKDFDDENAETAIWDGETILVSVR